MKTIGSYVDTELMKKKTKKKVEDLPLELARRVETLDVGKS